MKVHMENIQAIIDWPTPKNVTELREFLGICTYYRKFVKGFSQLAATLIDLMKNEALYLSKEAEFFFEKMKKVMNSCPVLALPDFTQLFVLECDSSGKVLEQ